MARPRDMRFFEVPLPKVLPEKEKWLPKYHKNSEALVCYMEEKRAGATARHASLKCLTLLREYLLKAEIPYSPENASPI